MQRAHLAFVVMNLKYNKLVRLHFLEPGSAACLQTEMDQDLGPTKMEFFKQKP